MSFSAWIFSILFFIFFVIPILYGFLSLTIYLFSGKTISKVYHYLRYVRFPPSHGDVEDFDLYPTDDPKMKKAVSQRGHIHKIIDLGDYNGSPYYRINTFYRGLFIQLLVPKRLLAPFLPLILNNQDQKFALRMRYDPMTFHVYEVQHLIHKKKQDTQV